jgi:hypothetical protein
MVSSSRSGRANRVAASEHLAFQDPCHRGAGHGLRVPPTVTVHRRGEVLARLLDPIAPPPFENRRSYGIPSRLGHPLRGDLAPHVRICIGPGIGREILSAPVIVVRRRINPTGNDGSAERIPPGRRLRRLARTRSRCSERPQSLTMRSRPGLNRDEARS